MPTLTATIGQGFGLEPADQGVRIGHVGGDDFGVASLVLGMQLVEVPRQAGGVVLGDGEDDRLPRPWLADREQVPHTCSQAMPVELPHHQTVGLFVGPETLELDGVVVLVVEVGPFGEDLRDARGEAIGHEVSVAECLLDRDS